MAIVEPWGSQSAQIDFDSFKRNVYGMERGGSRGAGSIVAHYAQLQIPLCVYFFRHFELENDLSRTPPLRRGHDVDRNEKVPCVLVG